MSVHIPSHESVREAIRSFLLSWADTQQELPHTISDLYFVQSLLAQPEHSGVKPQIVIQNLILEMIHKLGEAFPEKIERFLYRYIEGHTVELTAEHFGRSIARIKGGQQEVLKDLAQLIRDRELQARLKVADGQFKELPHSTYTELFGADHKCQEAENALVGDASQHIVVLHGLGGIGKTAVADRVVRNIIKTFHFDQILWIKYQPQATYDNQQAIYDTFVNILYRSILGENQNIHIDRKLLSIEDCLRNTRQLIVIDNLELLLEIDVLLPLLKRCSGNSKFLVTSRSWPDHTIDFIYPIEIRDLSQTAFLQLLKEQLSFNPKHDLSLIEEHVWHPFYEIVGGNPLFAKLIAVLLTTYDIPTTLRELRQAKTTEVEKKYLIIYSKVWEILSDVERGLMVAMVMADPNSGADIEFLEKASGLGLSDVLNAIQSLITKSLLLKQGDLQMTVYTIHALTNSFLQTDIIGQKFD